jgi:hypothetical protein
MHTSLFKSIAGSLAALTLGISVATTPALAGHDGGFGGGGFRSGFGGGGLHDRFGGEGFHGRIGGGGFRGGFDGYYGFGGYENCIAYQPAYDRSGRMIGQAPVNIC